VNCKICDNTVWVCEDHPDKKWDDGDGCCGAAGMLCDCIKHNFENPEILDESK